MRRYKKADFKIQKDSFVISQVAIVLYSSFGFSAGFAAKHLKETPTLKTHSTNCAYRVLSRIFCLGGKPIQKKVLSHAATRKIFLGLLGGPGACSPRKF